MPLFITDSEVKVAESNGETIYLQAVNSEESSETANMNAKQLWFIHVLIVM